MSLLDEYRETCHIMNLSKTADGEGGYVSTWTPGTEFSASIALSSKTQRLTGEHMCEAPQYTIFVDRSLNLPFHAIIKRENGKYLRILASNADQKAPNSSGYRVSWATAEGCDLP